MLKIGLLAADFGVLVVGYASHLAQRQSVPTAPVVCYAHKSYGTGPVEVAETVVQGVSGTRRERHKVQPKAAPATAGGPYLDIRSTSLIFNKRLGYQKHR